jgi:hypothetical protein
MLAGLVMTGAGMKTHILAWVGFAGFIYFLLDSVKKGQLDLVRKVAEYEEEKLSLACDRNAEPQGKQHMETAFYVQVSTDCIAGVEHCKVTLTLIEKCETDIKCQTDIALLWYPFIDIGTPKDILNGTPELAHVIGINSDNKVRVYTRQPALQEPTSNDGNHIFDGAGDYILHLRVSGKKTKPHSAKLKFKWTGDRHTAQLTLEPN